MMSPSPQRPVIDGRNLLSAELAEFLVSYVKREKDFNKEHLDDYTGKILSRCDYFSASYNNDAQALHGSFLHDIEMGDTLASLTQYFPALKGKSTECEGSLQKQARDESLRLLSVYQDAFDTGLYTTACLIYGIRECLIAKRLLFIIGIQKYPKRHSPLVYEVF